MRASSFRFLFPSHMLAAVAAQHSPLTAFCAATLPRMWSALSCAWMYASMRKSFHFQVCMHKWISLLVFVCPVMCHFYMPNALLSFLPAAIWSLVALHCPFLPFSHDNYHFNMRAAPFFSRQFAFLLFFCVFVRRTFVLLYVCVCLCLCSWHFLDLAQLTTNSGTACRFIFAHAFICARMRCCLHLFLWLYYMPQTYIAHMVTFPFKSIDTMLNGYKFVVAVFRFPLARSFYISYIFFFLLFWFFTTLFSIFKCRLCDKCQRVKI